MPALKTAITIVEFILGSLALLAAGDYLGHKLGRWRLATIVGVLALITIVVFVIYAAITLAG